MFREEEEDTEYLQEETNTWLFHIHQASITAVTPECDDTDFKVTPELYLYDLL